MINIRNKERVKLLNDYIQNSSKKTTELALELKLNYHTIYYQQNKLPTSNEWGGKRVSKFTNYEEKAIENELAFILLQNPFFDQTQLADLINWKFEIKINNVYICRILKRMGYSYKQGSFVHVNKYNMDNLKYYFYYLENVRKIDLNSLKYCDEAHYVSRKLFQSKGFALKNTRIFAFKNVPLNTSISCTILTSLCSQEAIPVISLRENSNKATDFIKFTKFCLENQHLVSGDLYIVDNSRVHTSEIELITSMCNSYNVKFILLPKYSAELNPAEYCFNFSKKYVKCNRSNNFLQDVFQSFHLYSRESLKKGYELCTGRK